MYSRLPMNAASSPQHTTKTAAKTRASVATTAIDQPPVFGVRANPVFLPKPAPTMAPAWAAAEDHRIGKLAIGDCAVWVGVSADHRGAAFDACRYVIDETKARVPIWKKEHYTSGATGWVNCATRVTG